MIDMPAFCDIHSHFVYGMDDGASSQAEMEQMLDAAYRGGIGTLVGTPHVTPALQRFDLTTYERHLDAARAYCQKQGYSMRLCAGAEILYTPAMTQQINEHRLPTIGEGAAVLVEFVLDLSFSEIEDAVCQLTRNGYVTILAHIERYKALSHEHNLKKLKEYYPVLYQVNAKSLISPKGFLMARRIRRWMTQRLVDVVACDAHDCRYRSYQMREAYELIAKRYDEAYAKQLTCARSIQL